MRMKIVIRNLIENLIEVLVKILTPENEIDYLYESAFIQQKVNKIDNFTKKYFKNILNKLFENSSVEKVLALNGKVMKEVMKDIKEMSIDKLFDEDIITVPINYTGNFIMDDLEITRAQEVDFEIEEPLLISR